MIYEETASHRWKIISYYQTTRDWHLCGQRSNTVKSYLLSRLTGHLNAPPLTHHCLDFLILLQYAKCVVLCLTMQIVTKWKSSILKTKLHSYIHCYHYVPINLITRTSPALSQYSGGKLQPCFQDLEMKAVQPRVLSIAPTGGKVEPTFPGDFNLAV